LATPVEEWLNCRAIRLENLQTRDPVDGVAIVEESVNVSVGVEEAADDLAAIVDVQRATAAEAGRQRCRHRSARLPHHRNPFAAGCLTGPADYDARRLIATGKLSPVP
jgi:hypothetical protein